MRRNKSALSHTTLNASSSAGKDISTTAIVDTTSISDTSASNLVNEQEYKIRNLLKELQNHVKTCEVIKLRPLIKIIN